MNTGLKRPKTWIWNVEAEAVGARLDQFVLHRIQAHGSDPSLSRAEVQRWIAQGKVTVNGSPGRSSDPLRLGGKVQATPIPPPVSTLEPEEDISFEILFLDDEVVVIDKPAGLVVHPGAGHARGTLVNGLLGRGLFTSLDTVVDPQDPKGSIRPGIVHRLDAGTSGVMVVARTARSREHLKGQFAAHTIEREYQALCVGTPRVEQYSTFYGRHPTDRLRFTGRVSHGKQAVTHVRVLEILSKGLVSHVACRLKTGRTHQIRVHLSEGGHPIVGDPLYGRRSVDPRLLIPAKQLGRPALHARKLGFVHPVHGEFLRFEVPPPVDYQTTLLALRA